MARAISIFLSQPIYEGEIEAVLKQQWHYERDQYGFAVPLDDGRVIFVEDVTYSIASDGEMTQNAPEIIKQAKWAGINRWGKPFKVVSRIAVIFENSEPDQLEWNTAVAIGAAFSQQFAGAVMHNHAGRAWKV